MIIEGDDITPSGDDDILQDSDDSVDIITARNKVVNKRNENRQETFNRDSDESSDGLSDLMVVTKGETAW